MKHLIIYMLIILSTTYETDKIAPQTFEDVKPTQIVEEDINMHESDAQAVEIDKNDLDLLARVIYAEAGGPTYTEYDVAYWCGVVVVNRVNDSRFPNTISEVLNAPGQYACVKNGTINHEPDARALQIAELLLTEGVPSGAEGVVWQAEFKQGKGIYKKIPIPGNRYMYFCY